MSASPPDTTPLAEPPAPADAASLELLQRQWRRERSVLLTALMLAVVALLLMRVGTRVWAVAVYDPAERTFVEHAYLARRDQANEALNLIKRRAQANHAFYQTVPGAALFGQSRPDFEQPVRVEPARRMVQMPAGASAQTPVVAAADALGQVLRPVVDAWGIYDTGNKVTVVALPTKEQAEQALNQRLEDIVGKVKEDLGGHDQLVSAGYLQKVEVRPAPHCLVASVLTVPQAVDYLSSGARRDAQHQIQAGESAKSIAAKYKTRLDDLIAWNPGRDLARLREGETIYVRRPDAPLTVLTVERRTYHQDGRVVTMDVRRHDGVETNRQPAEPTPSAP